MAANNKQFFRKIHNKVGKAIRNYQLIDNEDTVVVGLSGGKDSLALLDILSGRIKYSDIAFQLVAVHVDIKSVPYSVDLNYLHKFCEDRAIPFHVISIEFSEFENDERNNCFVCSWNRRKLLFQKVQELGYKKLALGHHKNDAVETLLMNMAFQGNISSMPPRIELFNKQIEIIRPLIMLRSEELKEYAQRKKFAPEIKKCPFENKSKRSHIKEVIQLLETKNPQALNNLFASMSNIMPEYLF